MVETLLQGADLVLTMDDHARELAQTDILIRDGVIAAIGKGLQTTGKAVSMVGCVITPGLVNTHHHLRKLVWQSLR